MSSRFVQIFNSDILNELEKTTEVGKVTVGAQVMLSGTTLKLHLHENDNFVNKLGICCADYNEDDNEVKFYTLSRLLDPSVGELEVIEHLDQGLSQSDAYNKIAGMLHEYAYDVAGQIRLDTVRKRRFANELTHYLRYDAADDLREMGFNVEDALEGYSQDSYY